MTILFGVFIALGEVNDNIPKITNIYRILFPEYINFTMNSEKDDFFRVQGTVNGKYKIDNNFLKIKTEEFALQYDNHKRQSDLFAEKVDYVRIGLGQYTSGRKWNVQIFSQEIQINKFILENGSLIIEPREFIIPISFINSLDKYWIVLEIGSFKNKNNIPTVNTAYTHSKKNIFQKINTMK